MYIITNPARIRREDKIGASREISQDSKELKRDPLARDMQQIVDKIIYSK